MLQLKPFCFSISPFASTASGYSSRLNVALSSAQLSFSGLEIAQIASSFILLSGDSLYPGEICKLIRHPSLVYCASHTHFAPHTSKNTFELGTYSDEDVASVTRLFANKLTTSKYYSYTELHVEHSRIELSVYRRKEFLLLGKYFCSRLPNSSQAIDNRLTLLTFISRDREAPHIQLIHYPCHPVVDFEEDRFSADFIFLLKKALKRTDNCIQIFLQGAAGDIRPNIFRTVGVIKKFTSLHDRNSNHSVSSINSLIETACERLIVDNAFTLHPAFINHSTHRLMLTSSRHTSVHALHLGPIKLLFLPFEVSNLIQLELSPHDIYIVSCSTNQFGYLPHPCQIPYGGYEVSGSDRFFLGAAALDKRLIYSSILHIASEI